MLFHCLLVGSGITGSRCEYAREHNRHEISHRCLLLPCVTKTGSNLKLKGPIGRHNTNFYTRDGG